MNSLFESRVHRLEENEWPVYEHSFEPKTREIHLAEGHSMRQLTELYWKEGLLTCCTLDGTSSQAIYTTRVNERSSGARNIRSPRNTTADSISIIPRDQIFCPMYDRTAGVNSSDYADLQALSTVRDPRIYVGGHEVNRSKRFEYPIAIVDHWITATSFVSNCPPDGPMRLTENYVYQNYITEISFDLKRVYLYSADLISKYYTGLSVTGAISTFTNDVAKKLGLPYTNLYPLIKQWMLDSEHPILAMQPSTELTLYMIPRTFNAEKLETLKHIILQRFDVLEVDFKRG